MYDKFLKFGYPNGWPDSVQHNNFLDLLYSLKYKKKPIEQLSFLDVGCGTGDLFYLLKLLGCKKYTGIDKFEPSLDIAHYQYPDGNFVKKSAFKINDYYDYIIASGLLSTMDSKGAKLIIYIMWQYCKNAVAFNFISEETSILSWYNVDEIIEYCELLSKNISVSSCENQTTIILCK